MFRFVMFWITRGDPSDSQFSLWDPVRVHSLLARNLSWINAGWGFGNVWNMNFIFPIFSPIVGMMMQSDSYFSDVLKPPTRI